MITETNEWEKYKNIKISKKGYESFFSSKNDQREVALPMHLGLV